MNNNGIAQPGEASPEAKKPNLYQQCLKSATRLTPKDREALEKMDSDPLIQALFRDLKDVAFAEKDFIGKYYQIISKYLEEQLINTHKELDRERCQFLRVVEVNLLPKLANLARGARKIKPQRNRATLDAIIDRWKEQFGGYKSLTTDPKIPIADISRSMQTSIGLPILQTPRTLRSTKTVMGMPVFNPQPAVQTPSGSEISLAQIAIGEPENPGESTPPEDPATDSTDVLPILRAQTDPGITRKALQNAARTDASAVNVDELITSTITNTPPKNKSPNVHLQTLEQQKAAEMYRNPALTISDIYHNTRPSSGNEWAITRRNLQEEMVKSFQALTAEIASSRNFDERLQQITLQCIKNAFAKTGDPQYRKRIIHEFFTLLKSTKDTNKRKILIQMFELVLSNKQELKQPIKPSKRMQRIHKQSGIKTPKTASPSAFTQATEILNQAELAKMPKDLQGALRILFRASQRLGLNHMPMSGVTPHSIASMKDQDFETMCYQTLNILREANKKISGLTNPRRWNKENKQARKFIAKLKQIIPAQLAIMEQLLYSETLFIPANVQIPKS